MTPDNDKLQLPEQLSREDHFRHLLTQEINRLIEISKGLRDQINEAKTQTKKSFYHKKLKKNNLKLMGFLTRLNQLNQIVDAKQKSEPSNLIESTPEENLGENKNDHTEDT